MEFGPGWSERKMPLLLRLESAVLSSAPEVLRLHECLCFLRAYPDDPALAGRVERMLGRFDRRRDLRRHRSALADSGIAGTAIHFRFFQPTASWLARRWGSRLRIEWPRFRRADMLARWLPLMTLPAEVPALDEYDFTPREWVERMRGRRVGDAELLIRSVDALKIDGFLREKLYDEMDPPLRLAPGPTTPSRTRARLPRPAIAYQRSPLDRRRPDLKEEIRRGPIEVRESSAREARAIIDLARGAMVTRSRDLDVFSYADPRDVRIIACGEGLELACIGFLPERRLLLESVYGFLMMKNGAPIGYVLCSALFGSSEIAFNVFETFRGGETARIYARVLAMVHALFGSDAFAIDPYQIGRGNAEAIRSGAWWFYQKMGFRPLDRTAVRLMNRERRRIQSDARHRSSRSTLERLAESSLYYFLNGPRKDVIGRVSAADVGLRVMDFVAARFGADRDRAEAVCAREAARRAGLRSESVIARWPRDERMMWRRWSPLILLLPGLDTWSAAHKRSLVSVVRAKGGRRESEFVARFDAHRPLRRAVLRLAGA